MTTAATRAAGPWTEERPAGLAWRSVVLAGVGLAVFKLAISDGGRDLQSLVLAQTAILAMLAVTTPAWIARGRLTRPLAGMIAAVAVTSLWSVRPESSVRELLLWTTYAGIAVLTATSLRGLRAASRFADALLIVGAWLCLVALFMFWGQGDTSIRWYSTFYWPNPFAAFLLLLLPLVTVRLLRAATAREAVAHGILLVLLGTSFVFTSSRGAWLSAGAVAPVMLAVLRPRSWRVAARRAALGGMAVVVAVMLLGRMTPGSVPQVAQRAASIADPADPSIQGRLNFWSSALRIFATHPVVGTGPGTFGAVHAAFQRDVRFYARDPHNLYLQTLAEMGIVGLAALAILLAVLGATWGTARQVARADDEYSVVAGAGLGVLAFLIHSGLDMDWSFPANPAMAFALIGIVAAATGEPRQGRRRPLVVERGARLAVAAALLAAIAAAQSGRIAHAHFVGGSADARQGRWSEADSRYAEASRWNPLSGRYLSARASAMMHLSHPDQNGAERVLQRAMVVDRMNASHPLALARTIMTGGAAGRAGEAERLLRLALSLDPLNRPEAYQELARLYVRAGREDDAGGVYAQALARYLRQGIGADSIIHFMFWQQIVDLALDAADFAVRRGEIARAAQVLRDLLADDPRLIAHPRVRALREALH